MPLPRIAVSDAAFQASGSSEAGREGELVMLPAGCSQQRQPGETLGCSAAGAGGGGCG